MALLKSKEIAKMVKSEKEKKLKELKLELVKTRTNVAKTGSSKSKEIRRMIARIMTFNKSDKEELKKK